MAEPAEFAQADAYDAQGNPVAPELVGEAVAKGQAFFKKGARVYAQNPNGELVTVDAADATKPGYTVLTPEQVKREYNRKKYGQGAGNIALAGAAGAARGLTLGASDAVLAELGGDETRRALKGLREANPIASGVGEVAGAVAPVVLSGGSAAPAAAGSAAARGGASLGARALSGAATAVRTAGAAPRAAAAAGGIVERGIARGLQAAGYEGKTVLGRAAAGALKTAGAGATEGAIYGGAQAANDAVLNGDKITAEKIVAGMGRGALFGAGVGGALGAAGPLLGAAATKLRPSREGLEQTARDQGLRAITQGASRAEVKAAAGGKFNEKGFERLDTALDDLLTYEIKNGPYKGQRVLTPGGNAEEIAARLNHAKEEVGAMKGGMAQELSERMAAEGRSPDVGEFLRRVKEQVTDPLRASKSQGAYSKARAIDSELSIYAKEHQARLAGAVDAPAAPTFADLDAYKMRLGDDIRNESGNVPKARQEFEKVRGILSNMLKEEAGTALQRAGENPNAYNELNRLYSSFAGLGKVADSTVSRGMLNRAISPSDHALGVASFLGALATGNVGALGAMAYGGAATMANKLLRERGNSFVAYYAQKAAQMDDRIDQVAQALAGRVNVKPPALAASLQGEGLRDSYQKTSERIRELSRPQMAAAHVEGLLPEVAAQYPQVGSAVSAKLLGIYQQLAAKLPASHVDTGQTLTPLAIQRRVTPQAMRSFMSSVRGALEPESVISDLARGIVDRDAIAALKEAHPETFQQLRTKVADYVEQNEDELPFKRRIMLSMTFDFVGDSSLEPQRLAGLQQAAEEVSAGIGEQQQGAPKPRLGNPGKSRLGDSFKTPGDSAFGGT
jgi:hypothetical protein